MFERGTFPLCMSEAFVAGSFPIELGKEFEGHSYKYHIRNWISKVFQNC